MNKLNIELTNCFGIDSLNHEFDFGKGNTFSIYARNGLMKTSFAKTFQLIQQGKKENISDGFEFLFVRLAPIVFWTSVVGIVVTYKKR